MPHQVLARKYRPQHFAEVIGQEHVTRTLTHALEQERIAHGYIFSGHRGIGKTTVARILAMALNCRAGSQPRPEPCAACDSCVEIREGRSVDVIEIDAATNRGIDEIRELREAARYRPARDRYKIYILDEAHQITEAAFNALLKTLEEPPPHVIFMMATTQPEDIPQTIRSRCQHFSFRAVRFPQMLEQLRAIAAQEQLEIEETALALVAEAGEGSLRDALSILDQAAGAAAGVIRASAVEELVGAVPGEALARLLRAVSENSSEEVLRLVDELCSAGENPVHFARQVVRFLRNALMAKVAGAESQLLQVSADERARVAAAAALFSEEELTRFLQIMLRAYGDISYRSDPRFHLELALVKLVHAQRLLPLEELLSAAGTTPGTSPRHSAAIAHPPSKPQSEPASTSTITSTSSSPSPFERNRARKTRESMSAAPAAVLEGGESPAASPAAGPSLAAVREAVLAALAAAAHRTLASTLETAEWQLRGNELLIESPAARSLLELAFTPEARRVATAAATAAAGAGLKLRLESTAVANGSSPAPAKSLAAAEAAGGRRRAADDPIVRRVQEKFGAEIRTVIDYREKRR